jgi:hypothetical protein
MSFLSAICDLSRFSCSDEESNDVVIDYPEDGSTVIKLGERRPLRFRSAFGKNGDVVLSSLESLSKQFAADVDAKNLDAATVAAVQAQLYREAPDLLEKPMFYKPLSGPNWTRLFRIDRMIMKPLGAKTFEVSITGSLSVFELGNMPSYRALSYTWGSPFTGKPESEAEILSSITCNGAVLLITDNLFSALCYVWGAFGSPGWIWIDAICIDQTHAKEKSDLICQMDTIYSRAKEVIGWLGSCNRFAEDLIWATTDFIERFQGHENFTKSKFDWPAESLFDPQVNQFFHVDDLRVCFVRVFGFYNSCRWFKRAWITQEVVLAQRVRTFCGEFEVSWNGLQSFTSIMFNTGWVRQIVSLVDKFNDTGENCSFLHELYTWQAISAAFTRILSNRDVDKGRKLSEIEIFSHSPGSPGRYLTCFHELLCWTAYFRCSDVLDHVFSVIGLAGPEYKSAIMTLMSIDYTMKPKDFYVEIARNILSTTKYLDILIHAGIWESNESRKNIWPSWVPNYLSPSKYWAFKQGSHSLNAGFCDEGSTNFMVHGLELVCDGATFDTIEETFKVKDASFKLDLLEFCTKFPAMINGRPRLETLWRTLILDSACDGTTPAPNDYGTRFLATIAGRDGPNLFRLHSTGKSTEGYFSRLDDYIDRLNAKEILGEKALICTDVREYTHSVATITSDPKEPLPQKVLEIDRMGFPYVQAEVPSRFHYLFFKTKKGLMGICGGPCAKGDQVWALRNAHVPFILRRSSFSPGFELIGACFILDKMQGEMIRDAGEIQTIRLV